MDNKSYFFGKSNTRLKKFLTPYFSIFDINNLKEILINFSIINKEIQSKTIIVADTINNSQIFIDKLKNLDDFNKLVFKECPLFNEYKDIETATKELILKETFSIEISSFSLANLFFVSV